MDRYGQCVDFGNLGAAYRDMGEPRKAIECYKQALKLSKLIEDRGHQVKSLKNLWITHYNLGELKEAVEFLKEYLAIGQEFEDPRIISFCEQKLKELEESNE